MKISNSNLMFQNFPPQSDIIYKGHGKIESAPEATSILHVISHELEHVAEFKSQAAKDEVEIRNLDMEIHFEFRDGRLVAVGGKTQMTTAPSRPQTEEIGAQLNLFPNSLYFPLELPEEEASPGSEESILKDKLSMIQSELKSLLNKVFLGEIMEKENKDTQDSIKESAYKEMKAKLQRELEELKNRVEAEKSKELLLRVALSQSNKTGFINPEDINILVSPEKHLDIIS